MTREQALAEGRIRASKMFKEFMRREAGYRVERICAEIGLENQPRFVYVAIRPFQSRKNRSGGVEVQNKRFENGLRKPTRRERVAFAVQKALKDL